MMYTSLLDQCKDILTGIGPGEDALALFEAPFVDNFEPEEVLRNRLGPGMLPSRRARLR
jgi:hypothetical protein